MLNFKYEIASMLLAALVGSLVLRNVFLAELQSRTISNPNFTQAQDLDFITGPKSYPAIRQYTAIILPGGYLGEDFLWFPTRQVGDYVTYKLNGIEPGQYQMEVYLASSGDFGIVDISLNGQLLAGAVDLYTSSRTPPQPVLLGDVSLDSDNELRIEVIGTNPLAQPPHYQIGIDGIIIRR